ncbi:hypothetical protein DM01DRAFT_148070 [Hesseltinella vesiculosa]|uniref:Uncharacterized protein n=1 Tax=Hesseltinella vesiculosa TaxID=101127 RepID=A0A1X2GAA4_9FUNG|nr:hypothetical protein DM01DRAFT_148070 [Hesseltinella vesiculosa]
MTITYFQIVCPKCKVHKCFTQYHALRRHYFSSHRMVLPSRMSNDHDLPDMKLMESKAPQQPNSILYACPCCVHYEKSKADLLVHLEKEHAFDDPYPESGKWTFEQFDVHKTFHSYQKYCREHADEYMHIDSSFFQLLCISSIFVLQKRTNYHHIPTSYFDSGQLEAIRDHIVQEEGLESNFDEGLTLKIMKVLKLLVEKKKTLEDTILDLISLSTLLESDEKSVAFAVESLLPPMKDLNVDHMAESELTSSFIHPFIQALLAMGHENVIAKCSNTTTSDDGQKRPDYSVDMYQNYTHDYTTCLGEVKTKHATYASKVVDFYKLCILSAEAMKGLTHFLFFQAQGNEVTFYFAYYRVSIYFVVEVGTIVIPTRKPDLSNIITYLDTMATVSRIHRNIKRSQSTDQVLYAPILPVDLGSKRSLPLKQKPSLSTIR